MLCRGKNGSLYLFLYIFCKSQLWFGGLLLLLDVLLFPWLPFRHTDQGLKLPFSFKISVWDERGALSGRGPR